LWNERINAHVLAHFPVEANYEVGDIVGPETGLIMWMNAHKVADYIKADEVRERLNVMGFSPSYRKDIGLYEIHPYVHKITEKTS
jgi:hypothetical protein